MSGKAMETLRVGVQVQTARWQSHALDADGCEHRTECVGELRVTVHDEMALTEQEAIHGVGQVTRHLDDGHGDQFLGYSLRFRH